MFCFSKAKIILPDDVVLSPENTKHAWNLNDTTLFSHVHFTEFHIPHGARVEVYNPKTGERHHMDSYLRGAQTPLSVDGNECAVELIGEFDWDAQKHHITIDYIVQFAAEDIIAEDPNDDSDSEERRSLGYCGDETDHAGLDQIEPVGCTWGHQAQNAKAVVKIKVGSSVCTGFFFGSHNRLLTNHHCIRGFASGSASAEVILYYEDQMCGFPYGGQCVCSQTSPITKKIDVRALIATFPKQDASLISLDYTDDSDFEHKVVEFYDDLQATSSPFQAPAVGDHVYIISHPGGGKKVISRTNDLGHLCKITKYTSSTGSFRTNCETRGGSSGAPVFFANGHLLGLHNRGGSQNCETDIDNARTTGGFAMKKIWDEMKDSQFQCCGKFHKLSNYNNPITAMRFCDDIPYVWGDYHDDISSMEITPDCKVYAYEDTMMSGGMKVFSGNKATLGTWNNKISSLRFARKDDDRCWVKFWQNEDHSGTWYFFTQDQPIMYNDAWESGDSAFTSFKIKPGCAIKLYTGSKYTGESARFDQDQDYVGDDFNDQISSFRLMDVYEQQNCWVRLYKKENCDGSGGSKWVQRDIRDLSTEIQGWNDEVKSIKVKDDCMAQVFQDKDFEGTHTVFPQFNGDGGLYNGVGWPCISNLKYGTDDDTGADITMAEKITSFRLYHLDHRTTRRSLLEEETETSHRVRKL